jgi:zinc transport system permease protein
MTNQDVILSVVLSIIVIIAYIIFYNRLFLITYDEEYAKASGINVTFYQFIIALITALVIVIGMRLMGTLLISSLIVFPAIISKRLTNSFKGLVIASAIVSVICFVIGIFVSFYMNLPTGASIVAVNMVLLIITTFGNKIIKG